MSGPNDQFEKQGAYEGTGKTTFNLLNKEAVGVNMIDSVGMDGFRLNSDTKVLGPCAIFPNAVLAWRVRGPEDITEESLSLFKILAPKLDVLVIGYGDHRNTNPVSPKLILKMRKMGINMEVLDTEHAVAVYNFLVDEGRVVAAALIPPDHVKIVDSDVILSKERNKSLYADHNKNFLGSDKQTWRNPYESYVDEKGEIKQPR